jgi:hypothetical protein
MTEGMGKTAVCSGCSQPFRIGSARPKFAWKETSLAEVAWVAYIPTFKNTQVISALAIYHDNKRRAETMADEMVYPWMMREVLDDTQRALLEYPDQLWHTFVSPAGGVFPVGKAVTVKIRFETEGDNNGVQIRYTLDGSRPTVDSKLYEKPLSISKATAIRAACFLDGNLLPGRVATARLAFLDGLEHTRPGLTYRFYRGLWKRLPRFADLKPDVHGVAHAMILDITEIGGDFGLVFSGYLHVTRSGEYTFYTASDDGSALYVNEEQVVNNDGIHGSTEKSGKVQLDPGLHLIRVEYFDAGGGRELIVQWQGPGFEKQVLAGDVLRH